MLRTIDLRRSGIQFIRCHWPQGFVSVSADYVFPAQCDACAGNYDHVPSFTTVPLAVPGACPPPRQVAKGNTTQTVGGVVLRVNLVTS